MRSCFLERGFDGPFGQRVLRVDARRDDDGRDGHTDDVDRGVALAESFQWAMRGLAAALGLVHQLVGVAVVAGAVRYVFVVITHDAPDSFGRCGLMVTYAMYQAKLEECYSLALTKQLRDAVQQTAILLSEGKSVTISATEQELTTEQAARTLGVSRQTLVRMLDKGLIPFSRPSRHRRIRLTDLLEYERASRSRRDSSIRQMIAVGDNSALYDLPEPSPKEAAQAIAEVRRSQINATIAFLDANIIYSITLTDTLLTMSEHNLLFPLWSPEVLLEAAREAERTLPASVQASFQ